MSVQMAGVGGARVMALVVAVDAGGAAVAAVAVVPVAPPPRTVQDQGVRYCGASLGSSMPGVQVFTLLQLAQKASF